MTAEPSEAMNTDRELWREGDRKDDTWANSIHVTESGGIGINCRGHVIVKRLHEWHALARAALDFGRVPYTVPARPEPTIAELEAILNDPNPGKVTVNPDGSVTVVT